MYFSLIRYGNIKDSIKEVQRDLDIDLSVHLEQLTSELNIQSLQSLMKQKGMTGVQLLCTRSRKHPFMQRMAVNGIPRFIILDPDGKVWDASSRRPSDPVLGELLLKELK